MTVYSQLDKVFPSSFVAKFAAVLVAALALPVGAALLVPTDTTAGIAALVSAALAAGILAHRAISALLAPLERISDSLQRTEAGYRARPLPEVHRDEVGLLMECANRLALRMREQLESAIEEADRDPLTGLFNRRGLERRLPSMRRSTVLVIDLDHFKSINDTFGHQVGDRVLVEVADLLASTFRTGDLLARIGGEEFLACLPGATLEQGRQAAERIRIVLEDKMMVEGRPVTASIGVACDHHGTSGWQVLEAADRAVFQAKSAGRNRVICAKALPADTTNPPTVAGSAIRLPGG